MRIQVMKGLHLAKRFSFLFNKYSPRGERGLIYLIKWYSVVFGKKTISFPTFFFAPMCLFDSMINIPFVGYLLSAILDCLTYIAFLLLYRKKKYDYWMKNKV